MKSRAFAVAALILLAGCGGGGSSPATGPAQTPTQTQTPLQNSVNLTVSFPIGGSKTSSSQRAPKYVSPGSTQIVVTVNSVNGGAVPSWVPTTTSTTLVFSGAGQNCTVTGGTATCTIPVAAPPGSVSYTISAEDGSNNVLATVTTTITITQGTNNTPTVTLQGVVKTVSVTGAALTANTPIAAGETLTVSALDASGSQIVNGSSSANYSNPITLTDNDATGQTQLSVNGGTAASSVTVTNPSDVVKLTYTGQATNNFTITASGTGITGSGSITANVFDVTFTGTTLDDAAHGGLNTDSNYSEPTLFFSQPSGSQNVTGAEVGFTNAPYSKQFDLDPGNGTGGTCGTGGGIATFSASPATTFTVTATGVGVCKVRLKEHGTGYPITSHPAPGSATDTTHDGTFWISVTSATFTVNGKRHQTQ